MKNYLGFLFILLFTNLLFSQKYNGSIVTVNNDTIRTKIEFTRDSYDVNRLRFLQNMIVTYNNNEERIYFPFELISFDIEIDYQKFTFDNINNEFFAQRLYRNKIRVNKYIYPTTNILITSYLILRPNSNEVSFLKVGGLSNLVSRKAMLKEFSDCPIVYNKIKSKEIKIKDEQAFLDFIKEFELNCF